MKKRIVIGEYACDISLCEPVKNSSSVMKFPSDLPIFCPLMVIILLCIQYRTAWCPLEATDCAISHSWCGNMRSIPPPCISNFSPRYFCPIAEHSKCQPGKPSLHLECHLIMCSGEAFFHRAKSTLRRLSDCPSSSRVFSIISSILRPDSIPYRWYLL